VGGCALARACVLVCERVCARACACACAPVCLCISTNQTCFQQPWGSFDCSTSSFGMGIWDRVRALATQRHSDPVAVNLGMASHARALASLGMRIHDVQDFKPQVKANDCKRENLFPFHSKFYACETRSLT